MIWLDAFRANPVLLYGAAISLGLVIGSFLNVVVLRLPRMLAAQWRRDCAELNGGQVYEQTISLVYPPSHCPACGHRIRAFENVPVLSWIFLRGRCGSCGAPISIRYPLVEALTGALTLCVVLRFGLTWETPAALILTWGLVALAFIDLDTQLLPDGITLPLLWLGLILSLFDLFTDSASAIIGAVAGYLSLWTVFQVFRILTGKEGMGFGDFKLFALFGAWLGWQLLPQIILLSALAGALLGSILIASGRHDKGVPIPFGPFLATAGWISLLWGEEINAAYLGYTGLL